MSPQKPQPPKGIIDALLERRKIDLLEAKADLLETAFEDLRDEVVSLKKRVSEIEATREQKEGS